MVTGSPPAETSWTYLGSLDSVYKCYTHTCTHNPWCCHSWHENLTEEVCVELSTLAVNMTLLAFAAERLAAAPVLLGAQQPLLLINISCWHSTLQQTHCISVQWAYDGRTDRWTPDHFINLFAPHTVQAVSVSSFNNVLNMGTVLLEFIFDW